MTPCWLHEPPPGVLDNSVTVCTGPPPAAILRKRVWVKNASDRLSGDQNGNAAPSVSGSAVAVKLSTGLTHNSALPSASGLTNATVWPSGEIVPLFDPAGEPSGAA